MSGISADDQAAHAAESLLSKGGAAGDMPMARTGESGAEGGFTPEAGGKVIDANAKGGYGGKDDMNKAGKTGADVTGEPGAQMQSGKTGDDVTNETKGDDGSPQPGDPGMNQAEDEAIRARKEGKIGVSGGSTGGGMPENEDEAIRARKAGKAGMAKGLKKNDDEKDDEENGENMEKMGLHKGDIDADDLMKSIDTLEAMADGSSILAPEERRKELAKSLADGTLSADELAELHGLTGPAGAAKETPMAKSGETGKEAATDATAETEHQSATELFNEDEDMQKSFDASPFLERMANLTATGLDAAESRLAKSIEEHRDGSRAFNKQLAKSFSGLARLNLEQRDLIKSLEGRLTTVEDTPLPRKGARTGAEAQVLSKGMNDEVGGGGQGKTLSRTDLMDGLEDMAKSMAMSPSGFDVQQGMALLEQSGDLPRPLFNDIKLHLQKNGGMVRAQ